MQVPAPRLFSRIFVAASIACLWLLAPVPAGAFGSVPEPPVDVVEFYNVDLHHYFLTAHADEMAAIDAGSAGAGWTRTGWSFSAYRAGAPGPGAYCPGGDCGAP